MSLDVWNAIMLTTGENDAVCKCGHRARAHEENAHCWLCFARNLEDNEANVPVNDRAKICPGFERDNLIYLEQEYERLSKRIRGISD